MSLFEALSVSLSIIAILISVYTLYISRRKGRLRVNFDIKMYQIRVDIINAGENPLVITNIGVSVFINGASYFGILPKEPPQLPLRVDRWGVVRLDDFKDSIEQGLSAYFSKLNSLPAKISIFIETSQGDTYYRITDQEIDLFKSVALASRIDKQ